MIHRPTDRPRFPHWSDDDTEDAAAQDPGPDREPFRLLRFIARSAADGTVAGWVVLLLLINLDVGSLGALVHGTPGGALALVLLAFGFGWTFALAGIAWGVMVMLPHEE